MSNAVLSSSTISADDGAVSRSSPRAGGPSRRRFFTPAEKLGHVLAYEAACERSEGGGVPAPGGVVLLADLRVAPAA